MMRRAGRGAGDRAGEAAIDRAVQMAAQHALDLRVAGDDLRECAGVIEPALVHALDAGQERRMMHHQERQPVRRCRQRAVEPGEPVSAQ